jgi:gluconolactonase
MKTFFKNGLYRALFILLTCFLNLNAQSILDPNAKLETIAVGIQQPEGPVWKDGVGLLFSDIQAAKIYKWESGNSSSVFMEHSDSTNGLAYDLQGRLIAGQMGKRRIVRFEEDGTQTDLASKYQGKRFNSPNDLVVKSDGSIFFTDPDFNIPGGPTKKELSFQGIYRISLTGNIQLLDGTFDKPNGICFSPDEKKLYVNESPKGEIYVWDVVDDSTIANKKLFAKLSSGGYADGMKTDPEGNVYCTGPKGVWVYSPDGKYIGLISLPNNYSASNIAWGEADRKTMFITCGGQNKPVYKIRPLLTGIKEGILLPEKFKLEQNYPNPFNPQTTIGYQIHKAGNVSLKIYDTLGNKIATLVDEFKPAGIYNTQLSASELHLSSSIYYYQLTAGNLTQTKKMIYLK